MTRRRIITVSLALAVCAVVLVAITKVSKYLSGPVDPYWDKTTCEMCRMALTSRRDAVLVTAAAGRKHYYDDLGCAMRDRLRNEVLRNQDIFVRSGGGETDTWLDARTIRYSRERSTPMGYGYSYDPAGSLTFSELEKAFESTTPPDGQL